MLTSLVIGIAFGINATVLLIVLRMRRRRRDGPPRIIYRDVPVIKEVIREVPRIREVIREVPRRRVEAEVSDEAMRAWYHLRD